MSGQLRSHAENKTKRTFRPNLCDVTLISDALAAQTASAHQRPRPEDRREARRPRRLPREGQGRGAVRALPEAQARGQEGAERAGRLGDCRGVFLAPPAPRLPAIRTRLVFASICRPLAGVRVGSGAWSYAKGRPITPNPPARWRPKARGRQNGAGRPQSGRPDNFLFLTYAGLTTSGGASTCGPNDDSAGNDDGTAPLR